MVKVKARISKLCPGLKRFYFLCDCVSLQLPKSSCPGCQGVFFLKPLHSPKKCHILCAGNKLATGQYFKGSNPCCLPTELGRVLVLDGCILDRSGCCLKKCGLGESVASWGPGAADFFCRVMEPCSSHRMTHELPWVTGDKMALNSLPQAQRVNPSLAWV